MKEEIWEKIGRRKKKSYEERIWEKDKKWRMIEILRIKRKEGKRIERNVEIGIGRRIEGKMVLKKIEKKRVEE